eukprot:4130095-Pleurochrysis_carterae.AAC.1
MDTRWLRAYPHPERPCIALALIFGLREARARTSKQLRQFVWHLIRTDSSTHSKEYHEERRASREEEASRHAWRR